MNSSNQNEKVRNPINPKPEPKQASCVVPDDPEREAQTLRLQGFRAMAKWLCV